jgi:inosine-uridine nucleoside N-ribohydrolase
MTRKIIIDTDPGVDDVLALAVGFLTPPNDAEIALISVVFGNSSLFHTARNTITLLSVIDQEREWRMRHGYRPPRSEVPLVAIGAEGPINGSRVIDAKHFHGKDGIADIHTTVFPVWMPVNDSIPISPRRTIVGILYWKILRGILYPLLSQHTQRF